MADISGLSKKEIQEEYEDLVFRKVMAIYVQKEGKQILSEIEEEKKNDDTVVDSKTIVKLYDKKERKENLNILWKYSKKLVQFAAMVVFVAIISLSSVVVAFADVREAVVDIIYHLVYEENERYTQVGIGESTGFIDPEIYDWEGAYAPTYMPEEYILKEKNKMPNRKTVTYTYGEKYVAISQSIDGVFQIDTEGATVNKKILINDSEAFYVEKNNFVFLVWNMGDTFFFLRGTIDPIDAIKIAESIKLIK